jgi:hypothetical protein
MLERWFAELGLPGLQWWVIPAAGGLVGSLILFLCGWAVSRRHKARTAADPLALKGSTDRRASHRRQGGSVLVDITDGEHQTESTQGWVMDRSLGGLGIEVAAPQPTGALLLIRPASATALVPWTQVEVRGCRREGDRWQLGCQFVRTPPYSILLLFG